MTHLAPHGTSLRLDGGDARARAVCAASVVSGVALAACAFAVAVDDPWVQLTPAGDFRARDGRPTDAPHWRVDAAVARDLIAAFAAEATRPVVDYEHQTLHADQNGQPAPAAGFIVDLAWRDGEGLFARVDWTQRAREFIAAGEYRYLSPVFRYDRSGRLLKIDMAALVNNPAIDGMQELSLRAAARFTHEEDAVDLKTFLAALAALLAIDPGSDQDAVLAACKAVVGKATEAETQLAALKQAGDPARFVPLGAFEALKGELAALKSAQLDRDVESLVETALADGKLLAVQTDWARTLGKRDLAALKAYLEKTPPIAALKGTQTGGKPRGDGGAAELDETEIAVCRAMGIQPDAYKKLRSAA